MDALATLMVVAMATWRLSILLKDEAGPWGVSRRLREAIGIQHYEDGSPLSYPDTMLGNLFQCIYCLSFWTGIAMLGLWFFVPFVVWAFAVSGGTVMIDAIVERLQHHG